MDSETKMRIDFGIRLQHLLDEFVSDVFDRETLRMTDPGDYEIRALGEIVQAYLVNGESRQAVRETMETATNYALLRCFKP